MSKKHIWRTSKMNNIKVDFSDILGVIKPMNAVNNGPKSSNKEQTSGNFYHFKHWR